MVMRPSIEPLIRSTIVLPERTPAVEPVALNFRSSHSPVTVPFESRSFDLISVLHDVLAQRMAGARTDPLLVQ